MSGADEPEDDGGAVQGVQLLHEERGAKPRVWIVEAASIPQPRIYEK